MNLVSPGAESWEDWAPTRTGETLTAAIVPQQGARVAAHGASGLSRGDLSRVRREDSVCCQCGP